MTQTDPLQQQFIQTIQARRAEVTRYIRENQVQGSRLANVSIICTALTAALTAGPGLGREKFTSMVSRVFGVEDAVIWGTLCFLALVLSIAAAVVTNMIKNRDSSDRLAKAQSASILLEKLMTAVQFEHMPVEDATKLYQQYISDIPFIQ